jgi:hypothetical protein
MTTDGKIYHVKIECVLADAPALAALKSVKNHRGNSACTKCEIVGNYSSKSNSVVYSQVNAPLWTDESFHKRFRHHMTEEHTVLDIKKTNKNKCVKRRKATLCQHFLYTK